MISATSTERYRVGWLVWQERALQWLDGLADRWCHQAAGPKHLVTGVQGEVAALFELRRQGYTIVARRWTTGALRGDVDLIGWDGEVLCFIEVKTRIGRTMYPADRAVDGVKRRILRALARAYTKPHWPERHRVPYRFDVVSVYFEAHGEGTGTKIEIIKQAFGRRDEPPEGNRR